MTNTSWKREPGINWKFQSCSQNHTNFSQMLFHHFLITEPSWKAMVKQWQNYYMQSGQSTQEWTK